MLVRHSSQDFRDNFCLGFTFCVSRLFAMLSREFLRVGLGALSYRSLPHDTHKFSLNNTWLDVHRVGFEEGIANSSFSPTSITLLTFPMKSSFFCTFMALAELTPEEVCLCPLARDFLYTEKIVMGRV